MCVSGVESIKFELFSLKQSLIIPIMYHQSTTSLRSNETIVNSLSTSPPSKRTIVNPYTKRPKEGKQVKKNDSLYDDLRTPNSKKLNVDVVTELPRNCSDKNNVKRQSNKQSTIGTIDASTKLNLKNDHRINKYLKRNKVHILKTT